MGQIYCYNFDGYIIKINHQDFMKVKKCPDIITCSYKSRMSGFVGMIYNGKRDIEIGEKVEDAILFKTENIFKSAEDSHRVLDMVVKKIKQKSFEHSTHK